MRTSFIRLSFYGLVMAGTLGVSLPLSAQVAPIFINPYQKAETNYTTSVPSIVTAPTTNQKTYNGSSKLPTYTMTQGTSNNPFKNSSFGRITNERKFYDAETGQYMNQYDYMGELAKRGNTSELQQVSSYLQQNGVFDPQKYNSAIQQALNPQQTPTGTIASGGVTTTGAAQATHAPVQVYKGTQTTTTPQKVFNGYDDDDTQTEQPTSSSYAKPIFLK